jgi:hypothetical protein
VQALWLIAITQRACPVEIVGAILEGQSRQSPFAISATVTVAIFALIDHVLVSICEEMCGRGRQSAAGITRSSPALKVTSDSIGALGRGETDRVRFGLAVDHLSDELARNDPSTRDKLRIGWDGLKAIPLFIYDDAISVEVNDILSATPLAVRLNAIVDPSLVELHVSQEMLGDREYGGRAIASLFPTEVRRKIGAEWALGSRPDSIRLASDEEHLEALQRQAGKISAAPKIKIKVTSPASRSAAPSPRTLKQMVGQISGVSVRPGSPLVLPIKSGSPAALASAPP